ncbi:MAG: nucleotidyltransferase family protein [Proteobacteria bacterium]|nr:nucleotidyltransferase family protein [Pseudomonadota bacterium]
MLTKKNADNLLGCLRAYNANQAATLQYLTATEWEKVTNLSISQKMAPLLYHRLRFLDPPSKIPGPLLAILRDNYIHNAVRNMSLFNDYCHVFRRLQLDAIPFIVLKGAHMAEVVYGDIALRPIADLDLLVKEHDLSRASSIFLNMGYYQAQETKESSSLHLPAFKKGNLIIEMHKNIFSFNTLSQTKLDGLWQRVQSSEIEGVKVLVLCKEDLLLHLILHICQHNFTGMLRNFCDIREVIYKYKTEINWENFVSRADEWNCINAVFLVLQLSNDILNVAVPGDVLELLKPEKLDPSYLEWAKEQIFADTRIVSESLAEMKRTERFLDKLKLMLKRVFPPRAKMAESYMVPEKSMRLYYFYLVRLTYLFGQYSKVALELFYRKQKYLNLPDEKRSRTLQNWIYGEGV